MYEAHISIRAETQQQLEHALSILSVDLNDTDLREGDYKSEFGGDGVEVMAVYEAKP